MQSSLKYGSFLSGYFQLALNSRLSTVFIQQQRSITKKSLYKNLNIPEKPSRPAVPFFKFIRQITPAILKEHPNVPRTEMVKIASQKWSQVDSKLKDKLKKEYDEEMVDYKKIMEEYNKSLTPEQKMEVKRAIQHNLDVREEKITKKKAVELGKPKKPPPVFNRFVLSRASEKDKYSSQKDFMKALGEEWKSLSQEFKNKLSEECKKENEKWSADMKIWEEKMIKEGNLDVVRTASLKQSSVKARIKK